VFVDRQEDAAPQEGKAEEEWKLKPFLKKTQSPIWWLCHLECGKTRDNTKGARAVR
jgi:hypothetical protein